MTVQESLKRLRCTAYRVRARSALIICPGAGDSRMVEDKMTALQTDGQFIQEASGVFGAFAEGRR